MQELSKLCFNYLVNCSRRIIPTLCCLCLIFISSVYLFSNTVKRQPKSDLDLYKFKYLIQNDICEENPYLLILVHSAANHFEHRNAIRRTLGNPGGGLPVIKIAFLLAIADEFQEQIKIENEQHRDLIQGNFVDSYRNLTYKHTMGLHWASTNCNGTTYLMKMDDDIYVDIYQLISYIQTKMKNLDLNRNIACYYQKSMPVVRDVVSKWFVSKTEFESDTFNDYCSGWAYITKPSVAGLLYETVRTLPYFWVDDVHLTGTAAQVAKVGRIRLNHLFALETDGLVDWTKSASDLKWDKVFAPTWGDLGLSENAFRKALKCHARQCKCCYKKATTPKPTTTSTTSRGVARLIVFPRSRSKMKKEKFYKARGKNRLLD